MRRKIFTELLGALARRPPFRARLEVALRGHANIAYFHGVRTAEHPFLGPLSIAGFDEICRQLSEYFTFVPLNDVLCSREGQETAGRSTLAITFDDGLDLIRSGVVEVLEKWKIEATVFLNTAAVGNTRLLWNHQLEIMEGEHGLHRLRQDMLAAGIGAASMSLPAMMKACPPGDRDRLCSTVWELLGMDDVNSYLRRRPYMDWYEIDEWVARGHEVGSHSESHPYCSTLTAAQIQDEVVRPVQALSRRYGRKTVPFAYPFGDRLPRDVEERLMSTGMFSCLLGIGGLSAKGVEAHLLDRANAEYGVNDGVFGRMLYRAARQAWAPR